MYCGLFVTLFFCFLGLRFEIGGDWFSYLNNYYGININKINLINLNIFEITQIIFYKLNLSFYTLNFFYHLYFLLHYFIFVICLSLSGLHYYQLCLI